MEAVLIPNWSVMRKVEMPAHARHQRIRRGSFSKVDRVHYDGTFVAREWLYCREYFQDESAGIRRMLFCHARNKSKNVAAFLHSVESRLCIGERSVVGPTQRNNISWIYMSPWWMCTSMKRSFFTVLLRCGERYLLSAGNFDEALMSHTYFSETEYAVRRFISGHTRYTGKKRGWYNAFKRGEGDRFERRAPPPESVDRLLVRPFSSREVA